MTRQTHHIDFDKLKDFAHIGVRRAVIFMGIGLNAAHREDFLDYELSKIPSSSGERRFPIEFFPEALPTERVNYFKVEFARWIQDCCLCDLLDHHALFLDKIHLHALVVYRSLGKLAEKDDPEKLHNKFRHEGITGKHKSLSERFGIDPTHSATIDQLYEARNALNSRFRSRASQALRRERKFCFALAQVQLHRHWQRNRKRDTARGYDRRTNHGRDHNCASRRTARNHLQSRRAH